MNGCVNNFAYFGRSFSSFIKLLKIRVKKRLCNLNFLILSTLTKYLQNLQIRLKIPCHCMTWTTSVLHLLPLETIAQTLSPILDMGIFRGPLPLTWFLATKRHFVHRSLLLSVGLFFRAEIEKKVRRYRKRTKQIEKLLIYFIF